MSSTSRFSTPPVQEAIVEFGFPSAAGTDDLTVFGRLYERIGDAFPDKEREVAPPLFDLPGDTPDAMRFYRADRTALVRAGEATLSVHHLGRHAGWEALRTFATEQLATFRDVATPERIATVAVRYVNRVRLPGPQADFPRYFRFSLPWPPDVADPSVPFRDLYVQAVLPYTDDALDLHVYLVHVPTDDDAFTYVLDLIAHSTTAPSFDEVPAWLDGAHSRIRTFFERAFTPSARADLFGEHP